MKTESRRAILGIMAALIMLFGCTGYITYIRHVAASALVTEITPANFREQVQNSKVPVYLEFYSKSDKCTACTRQAPVVEKVAADYIGKVHFTRVEVSANSALTKAAGIKVAPTHIFLNASTNVGIASPGELDEAGLRAFIEGGLNAQTANDNPDPSPPANQPPPSNTPPTSSTRGAPAHP